ncbi:MAG: 16S rRNA (cytosine(1402)-N(4))-methyltransferase RsmH [Nitrospirae bacterium]|nr:16S rRNA (cytosine(1402)-N(4))-methyltransferase RsmH [Nitrospirota bacterium]
MVIHRPVMVAEVMGMLNVQRNGVYVDGTVGTGGHALEIASLLTEGKLIAFDRDSEAQKLAAERLIGKPVQFVKENFSQIREVVESLGLTGVDGVLFDLGMSMFQVKNHERGFSFDSDYPLDMRMDRTCGRSAQEVVNTLNKKELEEIFRDLGEEPACVKIADAIVKTRRIRKIRTCRELSQIVLDVYGGRGKVHPATRTFQALRIYVNDELDSLRNGLLGARDLLNPGGRLCVISYHSLEDRIVKRFLAESKTEGRMAVLTKKPVMAQAQEIKENPAERSSKLRGGIKL